MYSLNMVDAHTATTSVRPALCSPPGCSPTFQSSDTSESFSLRDTGCAATWPEGSLGSSSSESTAPLLGEKEEGKQCTSPTLFPEVAWLLCTVGLQCSRPPQHYRAFRAATVHCLKCTCLVCACWLFVARVMGVTFHTTLHQSILFLLPIPFYIPILLCFVSLVVAWPRAQKTPPPVIGAPSPRVENLTVQQPAEPDLEAAKFVHKSCTRQVVRTNQNPLVAAARLTRTVAVLWYRHEAYLLVSCLAGGFGMCFATTVDAVLSSVVGPGKTVLVYSAWRSRRLAPTAATILFLLGSIVLTVWCVAGVLWAWMVAVVAWLSGLAKR